MNTEIRNYRLAQISMETMSSLGISNMTFNEPQKTENTYENIMITKSWQNSLLIRLCRDSNYIRDF